MSQMPTSSKRTKVQKNWQPTEADRAYAEERDIADIAAVAEEFRDYHAARGSLMLDWSAAWRTWVRNQIKWGKVKLVKRGLLNGNADDPFGALEYAAHCKYATPGTAEGGKIVPSVNGWDLPGVLVDVCEAAGLSSDWRGDLSPIAAWLRDGVEPEQIIDAIRAHKPPNVPGSWWFYEKRVRECLRASR
jgi:hypothetical protein